MLAPPILMTGLRCKRKSRLFKQFQTAARFGRVIGLLGLRKPLDDRPPRGYAAAQHTAPAAIFARLCPGCVVTFIDHSSEVWNFRRDGPYLLSRALNGVENVS